MPVSFFLAFRYLKPKWSLFSIITLLSLLGVALGVMVLIVTMAIMTGFGEMYRKTLMQFNAHVTVRGPNLSEWDERMIKEIEETPGVQAVSPAIFTRVMIKNNGNVAAPIVKGIDPFLEGKTSALGEKLQTKWPGTLTNLTDLAEEEVILGSALSEELGAYPGDVISIYSPDGFADENVVRLPEEVTVIGTFKMGMMMIDGDFLIGNLDTARDLANMEEGISQFVVQIDNPEQAMDISETLQEKLGDRDVYVSNWIRDNFNTYMALQTEKSVMFFLLLVIAIVGGFCMVCSLLIITVQKTHDIGLLKSMGYKTGQIVGIFTTMGLVLGVVGVSLGLVSGLVVVHFRKPIMEGIEFLRGGKEMFPDEIYEFDTLPAEIVPADLWQITLSGLAICILAGTLASLPAALLRPVNALRHD